MNDKIKRLWAKRRRVYAKHGRSPRWRKLKKLSDKLYRERAAKYWETKRRVLTAGDASRSFFKNAKAYNCRDKPQEFNVRDLFPGKDDLSVAEELVDYYSKISSEFDGLDPNCVPDGPQVPIPPLSIGEVATALRKFRKPKSRVEGDIFPGLVNRVSSALAEPLADIYNQISDTGIWPESWKVEYVTPIPKKTHT